MPLWAVDIYQQQLDPLGSPWLSTLIASGPVIVLFLLLVPLRWHAPKAALGGAITALLIAIFVYQMPTEKALKSLGFGMAFGLMPVGYNIIAAMFLYNITVETGMFTIIRRSVAELSGDSRVQAILIGFSFGAFLEGAAGGGTPVAICGAIMVGLGFSPFQAAVLCLIANTSPVAYGGLGTPLIVLSNVTGLNVERLSTMAGHQLPFLSIIIPLWMVRCMCTWKQTFEVLPALLVAGGSFAIFQYLFATIHNFIPGLVLYPMTDIGGGLFSLLVTAFFLRFWKPKTLIPASIDGQTIDSGQPKLRIGQIVLAWSPYLLMSVALMLTGLVRQKERSLDTKAVELTSNLKTNYLIEVPGLHKEIRRDPKLALPGKEKETESAVYEFAWFTSAGTAVFASAAISMVMLRMNRKQIWAVTKRTAWQMRIPIPTIAMMLGLSYVTRYGGLDATMGYAFAETGVLYPFFAAILGWLGVFLTGTDAGSNALFGSLQKIAATRVYEMKQGLFQPLDLTQTQVLICTANSTGGVMGKMIDAQSICVATAATNQTGKEADIFMAVVWHSIVLAAIVGLLVLAQAYVWPIQALVP